jgi:hypothetical protein
VEPLAERVVNGYPNIKPVKQATQMPRVTHAPVSKCQYYRFRFASPVANDIAVRSADSGNDLPSGRLDRRHQFVQNLVGHFIVEYDPLTTILPFEFLLLT